MLWVGVGAGGYQWTNFVFIINMNIGRPPLLIIFRINKIAVVLAGLQLQVHNWLLIKKHSEGFERDNGKDPQVTPL